MSSFHSVKKLTSALREKMQRCDAATCAGSTKENKYFHSSIWHLACVDESAIKTLTPEERWGYFTDHRIFVKCI